MGLIYDMYAKGVSLFSTLTPSYASYDTIISNPTAAFNAVYGNFILGYYNGGMVVYGSESNDWIDMANQPALHPGYDTIYAVGGTVYTSNSAGGDIVYGGNSATVIDGSFGTAYQFLALGFGGGAVYGGAGDDFIYGAFHSLANLHAGSGNQTIDAGTGSYAQIFAGSGTDTIYVNGPNATVTNSTGNDTISFSAGGGKVILGTGNSTVYGGPGTGGLIVTGGAGTGNLIIAAGGGAGNNITGGSGSGTNILFGGVGVDIVHGGNGAGQNTIAGYLGNDILYGGAEVTNNYFDLVYDVHAGDLDQIANWINTVTTHDWLQLPVVAKGGVNFIQNGADVYASLTVGAGTYGVYINNASLADVTAHTFYYG